MKDLADVGYHPKSEKLVEVLCQKTQNTNPHFFRILVAYNFAKVASMMRTSVMNELGDRIPINVYAINLALSGQGKGYATNIIEEQVLNQFKDRFLDETYIALAEQNIAQLAHRRAVRDSLDPDKTLEKVKNEFELLGKFRFSFCDATTPAIKQARQQLLMANCGSLNLEVDEIGTNLTSILEALSTYLELYDVGKVKDKLIKNTRESLRGEELFGKTPANMILYGTPNRVLDGGTTEDAYYNLLNTGYARRCIFGFSRTNDCISDLTPQEYLKQQKSALVSNFLNDLSDELYQRADLANYGHSLPMPDDVQLLLVEYKLRCVREAEKFPEHLEIWASEMSHRYFKAMKLAGAYAFIDGNPEITEDNLYQAIKLVEDSGAAFQKMTTKEHNHVKLARYIASFDTSLTQAELVQDLPYYPKANNQQNDILRLAQSWGYKNNVLIKREYDDGLEFVSGETMQETDLSEMIVSYSTDITKDYAGEQAPFEELHKLTQEPGMHWAVHHFAGGHRAGKNAIEGFNLLVLDVDDSVSLDTAKLLLKDYKYLIYTTKRHQKQGYGDRFRVVLPLNYVVKLDDKDYSQFMQNVFEWLPFDVDEAAKDIARKWESFPGNYWYNDGEMVDALKFIPKTAEQEKQHQKVLDSKSLTNLERWFILNTASGNRNHQVARYAFLLVDQGLPYDQIQNSVMALNSKLADKMEESEILSTVMVSVGKRLAEKANSGA